MIAADQMKSARLKFGSVCSGIEAASVAWSSLGWDAVWFSEVEKFPSAVLSHHYPDKKNLGCMRAIPGMILSGEIEVPDILCGGTPCQAFSVAGKRKSLSDARGNLSLTFCEIADVIDAKQFEDGNSPSVIFWENVPGVLSTKDNAFGCFLAGLAGEDCELQPPRGKWKNAGVVLGPKRAVAWRVFDAQYFGVAQRRRRVFVIASARKGFDPASILFEFYGVRRDSPPRRTAGEGFTRNIAPCLAKSGRRVGCAGDTGWQDSVAAVSVALRGREGGAAIEMGDDKTFALRASGSGGDKPYVLTGFNDSQPCAVAYGLPGNWIGRKPENGGNAVEPMHNVSPCLTGADRHGVVYAVHGTQDPCLSNHIAFALGRNSGQENVVALELDYGGDAMTNCAPTLGAGGSTSSHANSGVMPAIAFPSLQVRRLTPRECERLQGFPDDYTLIPYGKKVRPEKLDADFIKYQLRGNPKHLMREDIERLATDGHRYRALGNSWAVPNVRWIGERIQMALTNNKFNQEVCEKTDDQ